MNGVAATMRPRSQAAAHRAAEMQSDAAILAVAAVGIHSHRHPFPSRKDADVLF